MFLVTLSLQWYPASWSVIYEGLGKIRKLQFFRKNNYIDKHFKSGQQIIHFSINLLVISHFYYHVGKHGLQAYCNSTHTYMTGNFDYPRWFCTFNSRFYSIYIQFLNKRGLMFGTVTAHTANPFKITHWDHNECWAFCINNKFSSCVVSIFHIKHI